MSDSTASRDWGRAWPSSSRTQGAWRAGRHASDRGRRDATVRRVIQAWDVVESLIYPGLLLVGDDDVLLEHQPVLRPVCHTLHGDQVVERGDSRLEPLDRRRDRLRAELIVGANSLDVAEDVEPAVPRVEGEI